VEERRVGGAQARAIEPEAFEDPGRVVEDGGIGAVDERLRGREPLIGVEVEGEAGLVPVPAEVAGVVTGAVAAGGFDLDDFGAEVSEEHGRHRPTGALGEVDDAEVVEGEGHGGGV
jgi:hypothetical protein